MEVKSRKRGRPQRDRERLQKSLIVRRAGEMTLGLSKVPSIRALAAELDVDPMAIYHYFSNKKELLEEVCLSLIGGLYRPVPELGWQENLMRLCKSYLTLLMDYPDLVGIFLSASGKGAAAIFTERFEICVRELNLSSDRIGTVTDLLADYIHGFAYAAACNQSERTVSPELADGPLSFIFENLSRRDEAPCLPADSTHKL